MGNTIAAGNVLVVNLNANATTANIQALVRAITYQNSDTTSPTTGARNIRVTIDDGDGGISSSADVTVTVIAANDAPMLTHLNGDVVSYSVGGSAIILDAGANVTLSDVDSADFSGGIVTAAIVVNGRNSEDQLRVDSVSSISTSGSDINHSDGMTIGTMTSGKNGNNLVITLNANAIVARTQDLLKALQYVNADSMTVNTLARTVRIMVDDGDGGSSTSFDQDIQVFLLRAPIIDLDADNSSGALNGDYSGMFTEGGGAIALADTDSVITDDSMFKALTVILPERPDGALENLSSTFGVGAQSVNGETVTIGAYNSGTGVLSMSVDDGSATAATLQMLMQSMRYNNTSDIPDTEARNITLTATDDADNVGASVTSTQTVTAVNDASTLTATGSNPTFRQGGAAVDVFSDITASTVESGQTLEQLVITVTNVTDGAGASEFLSIDGQNVALSDTNSGITTANSIGYSIALAAETATVTLTKAGMSATTVQTLVDGLTYSNVSATPNNASRVVTITSLKDDGGTANGGADNAALSIASTVSVASNPAITNAIFDASTSTLVVTGTNFLVNGDGPDIDVSKLTVTGEGGETYSLIDSADVELDSAIQFTVTLSATDMAALNPIINKNGITSTGGAIYNLAAEENWAVGANVAFDVIDATGNGITASNVALPAITSATYDALTGVLEVAGTDLLKSAGVDNDIDASKFTLTGLGGSTYTLTDTADVDITSGTAFTLTLSATDKAAANALFDASGISASDATIYNLAAAEDWASGADAIVNVVDAARNGIVVTNPVPSGRNGNTTTTVATTSTTKTVDGVIATTWIETDGSTTLTIPVIDDTRIEDPGTLLKTHADISILTNDTGDPILTASLPTGVALTVNGQSAPMNAQEAINNLIQRIEQAMSADSEARLEITVHGQNFIISLAQNDVVSVQTIVPTISDNIVLNLPIFITGSDLPSNGKQALIIDTSALPLGTVIQLDNIAFAAIIGDIRVVGGAGENFVVGDEKNQFIVLGADDGILFGGGGNDTIGSLGGNEQTYGDDGNDIVYGGAGHDTLTGGAGNDALNGGLGFDVAAQAGQSTDYQIQINKNHITLTDSDGVVDSLTDIELIQFGTGPNLAVEYSDNEAVAHHLVKTWLGRDLTTAEGNAVQNWPGTDSNRIVDAFLNLPGAADLQQNTADELLAGLNDNPNILRVDSVRDLTGSDGNDQGYLSLGLALNVDGGGGHDVLRMHGGHDVIHLEQVNEVVEITRLEDGAMLSLRNVEMIAFDSGEKILFAHNQVEGILGRLFQTFFDRDATIDEWQLGREAIASGMNPEIILDWFQSNSNLNELNDTDYIQTLYSQTLGRQATETELNLQLSRLENGEIIRNWLAVDIANSDEIITAVGSVMLLYGSL